jgi:hypothetical protein
MRLRRIDKRGAIVNSVSVTLERGFRAGRHAKTRCPLGGMEDQSHGVQRNQGWAGLAGAEPHAQGTGPPGPRRAGIWSTWAVHISSGGELPRVEISPLAVESAGGGASSSSRGGT